MRTTDVDLVARENEQWLARAERAKARLLADPNRPVGLRNRLSRREAQEMAHPKAATCPRCRDLKARCVQVSWQYRVGDLCPCCWEFVAGKVSSWRSRRKSAFAAREAAERMVGAFAEVGR